jgi:CheY-like chemotaxis protein
MTRPSDPIEVLLVEDNPADVRLTRLALQGGAIEKHLNIAADGESALAFLRQQGAYADSPRPDLILLDLNLPGRAATRCWPRSSGTTTCAPSPRWCSPPATESTTSSCSYELAANCYVTKPIGLNPFLQAVRKIEDFWVRTASLPREPGAEGASGA